MHKPRVAGSEHQHRDVVDTALEVEVGGTRRRELLLVVLGVRVEAEDLETPDDRSCATGHPERGQEAAPGPEAGPT